MFTVPLGSVWWTARWRWLSLDLDAPGPICCCLLPWRRTASASPLAPKFLTSSYPYNNPKWAYNPQAKMQRELDLRLQCWGITEVKLKSVSFRLENLMFSFVVVDFGLVLSDKPVLPAVINEHKPHKIAQQWQGLKRINQLNCLDEFQAS